MECQSSGLFKMGIAHL